jgi:tRNA pseudouridine55 synthase
MDGVLIVDKPKGMTSHDVVDFVRKKFSLKKVGHSGTLDPMATGVLVILIGKATKLSSQLINEDKDYDATLTLGIVTDTGDCQGKVIRLSLPLVEYPTFRYSQEEIRKIFAEFEGEIEQIPPMFSALKYKGKRLYKLARCGIQIERKARWVRISKLQITDIDLPQISFRISCSKGTYVRSLAEDIGKRLGCGGTLSRLRRLRSGSFSIEEAVSWKRLQGISPLELEQLLIR